MAGKSYRGVGDDEESSRRTEPDGTPQFEDEDDSRGVNSGPTVVDDKKVAEVLKKLRSLDQAPGPLTGVTEVVVDTNSSEQTRIDAQIPHDSAVARPIDSAPTTKVDAGPASLQDIMYPLRATAIGRSLSTPADVQPVTIPADLARGTMFGRSIHLPDVNAPDEASIELSSGAVQFLEGTPPPSQPFPLADWPAVALPAPTAPAQRFHTPEDTDPRTQLVGRPRSKLVRVIALVGGFAVVAGAWFVWTQVRGKPAGSSPSPAAPAAAAQPTPAAAPAIVPIPTPAAAPAAAPADDPTPPPAADAVEPTTTTTRRAPPTPERRPAARIVTPSESSAPPAASKPVRSRRRAAIPEDPDATLPPSM